MKRRLHLRSDPLLLSPLPSRSTEGLSEAKTHTHTYTHLSLGHCCVFRPGLCQTSGLMQWRGDALRPPIPHGLQKAKLRSAAASQAALRAELGETRLLRCGMHPRHHRCPPPALPLSPRAHQKSRQSAQCGIQGDRLSFSSAICLSLAKAERRIKWR